MASFHAKTSWERSIKSENKNYRSDQFLPDLLQRIPKQLQKNSKKKKSLWLVCKPKQVGKGRKRVKIKIIVPISSYSTRNREFQKSSKKKVKKHHDGFFRAQTSWERSRKSENKNYRSDLFLLDLLQRIPKKQQKNSKN